MQITYTSHFQERAKLREIDVTAVQEIFLNPDFGFIDTKTGYFMLKYCALPKF